MFYQFKKLYSPQIGLDGGDVEKETIYDDKPWLNTESEPRDFASFPEFNNTAIVPYDNIHVIEGNLPEPAEETPGGDDEVSGEPGKK